MCLYGALCSILFNLICNMITFSKKKFDPTPGVNGVCKDRAALCSTSLNLICNLASFSKNKQIKLRKCMFPATLCLSLNI